jgi:cardiolipin synthase A/B
MLEDQAAENRVTFFDDGEALFEAMKAAIEGAQKRVWVETFMMVPDRTGRETIQLLSDAAMRGVDVVLLFDQAGSHVTNLGFFRPLEKAGGSVAIFNPLRPWQRWGRRSGPYVRYRDHRKTMIADDVGFCGGHNFSRAYMGPPPHSYYDMSVRLEGPAVTELARVFIDSLEKAGGRRRPLPHPPAIPDGVPVQVVAQDAPHGQRDVTRAWERLMDSATESALLVMAYFAPDTPLCAPLLRAAGRGVSIDLLTVGATDFPFVRWAGETAYEQLLRAGVRIYRLQEPKLHAKAAVVDGQLCMVGSFDVNTFERRNTAEVALVTRDIHLAAGIRGGFQRSLPRCERVLLEEWVNRSRFRRGLDRASWKLLRI